MILAALGFLTSLIAHVSSILHISLFSFEPWILHFGIFIVWFPAVLFAKSLSDNYPRSQFWAATLRGCPQLMKYFLYALFIYTLINFIFFALHNQEKDPNSSSVMRGISGHWLIFYFSAAAIFYSYVNIAKEDLNPKCKNGHFILGNRKFCHECGALIEHTVTKPD